MTFSLIDASSIRFHISVLCVRSLALLENTAALQDASQTSHLTRTTKKTKDGTAKMLISECSSNGKSGKHFSAPAPTVTRSPRLHNTTWNHNATPPRTNGTVKKYDASPSMDLRVPCGLIEDCTCLHRFGCRASDYPILAVTPPEHLGPPTTMAHILDSITQSAYARGFTPDRRQRLSLHGLPGV